MTHDESAHDDLQLRIGAATHVAKLGAPADGWETFADALLGRLDLELRRFAPDWLGHCKLLVETATAIAYASLTEAGGAPTWSGAVPAPSPADLTIYCAAYGLDDAEVRAAMDALIAAFPAIAP